MYQLAVLNFTEQLGYEIRSTSVHEQMLQMWKNNFDVKTVPRTKVHNFVHPKKKKNHGYPNTLLLPCLGHGTVRGLVHLTPVRKDS